jgi:AcrR family transcriptional regulator
MRREQLILQAAEKLFHERSYDGVGVDAIGKEAGIVGSGVYRHFASKDEILAALIDQATDALLTRLPEPSSDPREELRQLVTAHVEFAIGHERLADIWQREHHNLQKTDQRGFLRRQRRYIDRWVACLEACYPGHSREELLAAIRALHALITSDTTRRTGSRAPAQLPALLTALALSALEGLAEPLDREAAS